MNPIEFMNYERICDDLYFLGNNVVLRFNVGLASYKDGTRYFFHKEYEYQKEGRNVVTIKRSYNYYLTLEHTESKESIMITARDYPKLKSAIHTALSWFQDKKYDKLYVTVKGKLTMTSPIPSCEINSFPAGKYIIIEPIIIDRGVANDDKQPGVRIYLSDTNYYVNMSVDNLTGLGYIIDSINMIQMAQTMIASLPSDFNINRRVIDSKPVSYFQREQLNKIDSNNSVEGVKTVNGRFIGGKSRLEDL